MSAGPTPPLPTVSASAALARCVWRGGAAGAGSSPPGPYQRAAAAGLSPRCSQVGGRGPGDQTALGANLASPLSGVGMRSQ